jgi:hypothetical protein
VHENAGKAAVLNQILKNIQHLSMPDGGDLKIFSGSRCAGQNKNARPDDGPDPQRRQRPRPQRFLQPVFRLVSVRDQLVNGLLGEQLAGQTGLLGCE